MLICTVYLIEKKNLLLKYEAGSSSDMFLSTFHLGAIAEWSKAKGQAILPSAPVSRHVLV